MQPAREQATFSLTNLAVLPVWAAMIIAPRSRLTARLVAGSDALLVGLSGLYLAHLAGALERLPSLSEARAWRALLSQPRGFLAGWTHFVAFDLFVGRRIWATALAEGRSCRLALLSTFLAGPSGLAVFALQRRSLRLR